MKKVHTTVDTHSDLRIRIQRTTKKGPQRVARSFN